MAQHDYVIANQGFPDTRSDINSALSAIVSQNSGASAPSTTYANQIWYDSNNNILKMRNEDNDAWINLFTLNQTNDTATASVSSVTVANGGTGASTFAANGVLFGNGTSAVGATAVGTSGQVLTSNGSGSAPTFEAAAGGGGLLQVRHKNLGSFSSTTINGTVTVTDWDETITMSSSSNAILATITGIKTFPTCSGNNLMYTYLFKDGSQTSATALNSGTVEGQTAAYFSSQNYTVTQTVQFLEKPNTASAITYSVRPYGNTAAQTSGAMTWSHTTLTLMEIDGSKVTISP